MNDNCSEMNKRYDEWEKQAIHFAFFLQEHYLRQLEWLKEMADNGHSLDSLKDMINGYVQNAEDNYQIISDIYFDMKFNMDIYDDCKNFHYVIVKLIRNRACKLNAVADEMEREYNGGMTERKIEDMHWKSYEESRERREREALNGMTLQEATDNLVKILNNGYTYTDIMNTIKKLLEFEGGLTDFDPDRYEEHYYLPYEDWLLLDLQIAGVDADKVKDYLSTAFRK